MLIEPFDRIPKELVNHKSKKYFLKYYNESGRNDLINGVIMDLLEISLKGVSIDDLYKLNGGFLIISNSYFEDIQNKEYFSKKELDFSNFSENIIYNIGSINGVDVYRNINTPYNKESGYILHVKDVSLYINDISENIVEIGLLKG
jgi:hypothetical protein